MLRLRGLLCCCAAAALVCASAANAGVFSAHETANGADSPFTTLTDDVPTPWEVLLQPMVTDPASVRSPWFPEPGLGNHGGYQYGHILKRGTFNEGRPFRIIWDRLVGGDTPHLLWLNEGKVYATDDGTAGPEHEFFPEVGALLPVFHHSSSEASFQPQVIPLPTAAAVWFLLLLIPGRPRKPAPVTARMTG